MLSQPWEQPRAKSASSRVKGGGGESSQEMAKGLWWWSVTPRPHSAGVVGTPWQSWSTSRTLQSVVTSSSSCLGWTYSANTPWSMPLCHRIFYQCRGFLTPASTAQGNSKGAILGLSGLCKVSCPSFLLSLANQVSHAQSRPNSLSLLVLLSVREMWIVSDQTKCPVLILAPESSKDWQQVFSAPFITDIPHFLSCS